MEFFIPYEYKTFPNNFYFLNIGMRTALNTLF